MRKIKWSYSLLNKSNIRKKFLDTRKEIDAHQRQLSAISAADIFQSSALFYASKHIGCYLAREDEFDCLPIIQSIWAQSKYCYLPRLAQDKKLNFVAYCKDSVLQLNRYHIYEPEAAHFFSAEKLDLVLLPLVGFDEEGNRLGRGGGYYDKTFSFVKQLDRRSPFLLGLGFEQQDAKKIPNDEWDVKLNGVLTERRLIIFNIDSST